MKHMHSTPSTRARQGMRALAATLALTMAGGAMAQGFPGRGDGPGPRWDAGQRDERDHDRRDHDRRDRWERHDREYRRDDGRDYRPGLPRPHAQWHRGGYVPATYRAPQYVVTDWRARQLQAPPSGYQWMQVNGDFVLGAIAGGLIAAIVAGR